MIRMDWLNFLLDMGNSLEPYVTLVVFSIWLSYMSRRENRLLSHVSFLESVSGFLMVIVAISFYKIKFSVPNAHLFYTFLSYVGLIWGIQGLIWGTVFYVVPIEKMLKIEPLKKKGKKASYF